MFSDSLTQSSSSEESKVPAAKAAVDVPGTKCDFKAYHEKIEDGAPEVTEVADPFGQYRSDDDDAAYALIVTKTTEAKKKDRISLKVNSPHILTAFREAIKSYITVPSDFTSPCRLEGPFQMLVHHWEDLEKYREEATDATMREHLDLLFKFMEHEVKPTREKALRMIQKGQITFDLAWVLFRPGQVMYSEIAGHPWLSVCAKTAYESAHNEGDYLEIHCTYTDDNGMMKGEATHIVALFQKSVWAGANPINITELSTYPRAFHPAGEELEEHLRERGIKFMALKDQSVMAYDGSAEFLKEPPFDFYDMARSKFQGTWLPYTETGRVILDRKTFGEEQPLGQIKVRKGGEIEPIYCPPYTLGYSIGRKDWCHFFVDNLRDVEWKAEAWDSLILDNKEKLVLRSLVQSHQYSEHARDQAVQKGKGLVVLLHGTPGSGKTLTAETAAEGAHKALLSTSLGELNKNGYNLEFEWELKKILRLATIWKAVILLDEADVFLEAREEKTGNSTERNALVAVFLKELEYFSGVVFLTTNRVESFDEAMKSRVHLALTYSPPELEARRRIWDRYLGNVPHGESEIVLGDKTLEPLICHEMNGREISNVINTARTIARSESKPLRIEHLETVLEVRRAFDEAVGNGSQDRA